MGVESYLYDFDLDIYDHLPKVIRSVYRQMQVSFTMR
jgi:hypothetical protein